LYLQVFQPLLKYVWQKQIKCDKINWWVSENSSLLINYLFCCYSIDWLNRDGNIFAEKNPQTGEVIDKES